MTRRILTVAAVAAVVLLGGCAHPVGSEAPRDAAVADFCRVALALASLDLSSPDSYPDDSARVDAMHRAAADLLATGTPSDIDDQARQGFQDVVGRYETADVLSLSSTDFINAGAYPDFVRFLAYTRDECVAS